MTLLWYRNPAAEWTDALPIGNGRLAGMVFGGVGREELQLNESSLWSGGPYRPVQPDALPHLAKVRELIFSDRFIEAHELVQRHMLAKPSSQMSYQPAGNVFVEFAHEAAPGSYRRQLDLNSAIVSSRYQVRGTGIRTLSNTITRTAFASAADDLLAFRVEASAAESLDFEVWFECPQVGDIVPRDDNVIAFRGRNFGESGVEGRLTFGVDIRLRIDDGIVMRRGRRLLVKSASAAEIYIDIATSFRRFDDVSGDPEQRLAASAAKVAESRFDVLLDAHIDAHRAQFGRLEINLGRGRDDIPTDERIAAYASGGDPGLAALYVQFARYLMMASSRPGSQPSNLQGIWNRETRPPWNSKLTTNINLQMNYWLPDPANLPHSFEPLIAMVEDLAETGAEVARVHYGARGWVLHHNTDLWRAAGPIDGARWGMWSTGGAWLCVQLWDHASFEGFPPKFVNRIYPLLKGAAEFFLETLVEDPRSGELVTCPSLSPENEHPFGTTLCAGPAMDNQILRDLFDAVAQAARLLGVDPELVSEAVAASENLGVDRVGEAGQLQEWREDWDLMAPELHHRHVSHLYGLFPSFQINPESTPALASAARRSLDIRGDDATGWGIGWRINLWARLRDGDRAHQVLSLLISPDRSYRNLFDAHPPFQIDGNFGGAAGILEMLIQSRPREIRLLPALPSNWPSGWLRGVRARGGIQVDFDWEDGLVRRCTLRGADGPISLYANGTLREIEITGGEASVSSDRVGDTS